MTALYQQLSRCRAFVWLLRLVCPRGRWGVCVRARKCWSTRPPGRPLGSQAVLSSPHAPNFSPLLRWSRLVSASLVNCVCGFSARLWMPPGQGSLLFSYNVLPGSLCSARGLSRVWRQAEPRLCSFSAVWTWASCHYPPQPRPPHL